MTSLFHRDDRLVDLYNRNADEFTDEMTRIVELPTTGGMLARTEVAKEFRVWVLDVLKDRQMPREVGCMTIPKQMVLSIPALSQIGQDDPQQALDRYLSIFPQSD